MQLECNYIKVLYTDISDQVKSTQQITYCVTEVEVELRNFMHKFCAILVRHTRFPVAEETWNEIHKAFPEADIIGRGAFAV